MVNFVEILVVLANFLVFPRFFVQFLQVSETLLGHDCIVTLVSHGRREVGDDGGNAGPGGVACASDRLADDHEAVHGSLQASAWAQR